MKQESVAEERRSLRDGRERRRGRERWSRERPIIIRGPPISISIYIGVHRSPYQQTPQLHKRLPQPPFHAFSSLSLLQRRCSHLAYLEFPVSLSRDNTEGRAVHTGSVQRRQRQQLLP